MHAGLRMLLAVWGVLYLAQFTAAFMALADERTGERDAVAVARAMLVSVPGIGLLLLVLGAWWTSDTVLGLSFIAGWLAAWVVIPLCGVLLAIVAGRPLASATSRAGIASRACAALACVAAFLSLPALTPSA